MQEKSIIAGLILLVVVLYYIGEFLGCYHMITFSKSCDWLF